MPACCGYRSERGADGPAAEPRADVADLALAHPHVKGGSAADLCPVVRAAGRRGSPDSASQAIRSRGGILAAVSSSARSPAGAVREAGPGPTAVLQGPAGAA
jgi:hypothetical protein